MLKAVFMPQCLAVALVYHLFEKASAVYCCSLLSCFMWTNVFIRNETGTRESIEL